LVRKKRMKKEVVERNNRERGGTGSGGEKENEPEVVDRKRMNRKWWIEKE
jgi:hypothetical protein